MNATPTAPLTTARLHLDPLHPQDAAPMVAVLASPELYEFTGGSPPTLADLERRYAAQVAGSDEPGEDWHNWIIRLADGSPVGYVQASVEAGAGDVAWVIAAEMQGRGYAREATAAMCDWLHSVGVQRLAAHVHPDHAASRRVAAAAGFVESGERDDEGEDIWIRPASSVDAAARRWPWSGDRRSAASRTGRTTAR
jgi:RimJ/RimL family protein N-acetyltransferase